MTLVMDTIRLQRSGQYDENGDWWFVHATNVTKAFQTKGGLYTAMDVAVAYLAGRGDLKDIPLVQWTRQRDGDYTALMEVDIR